MAKNRYFDRTSTKIQQGQKLNLKTNAGNEKLTIVNTVSAIILGICAVVLYGWTAKFGWGLDDVPYIVNPMQKIENNWHGISTLLSERFGYYDYRPVVFISFWIESKIFNGLNPNTSHLLNAFIYGFLSIQIFRFILLANFYENKNKLTALALITTFLFIIHPSHVSVVANVKSRDNLLSMLFGITSTMQFLYYFKDKQWWRLPFAILFACIALLSKRDAYSFLLFPWLYYAIYVMKLQNFKNNFDKKQLKLLLGLFIGSIISIVFADAIKAIFAAKPDELIMYYNDSPLVNHDTLINRLSFSLTTLLYYLKFMVIPYGYYFYFGYNQIPLTALWNPLNILAFIIYFSLFILAIKWYKKDKIYLFSILFFMLSIAYAANLFVIVSGIVMDRYSFIASLGFLLGVSALIINISTNQSWRIVYDWKLAPLYVILIFFTIHRTTAWKDVSTLFHTDIPALKNSAQAHAMIGGIYINSALFDNLTTQDKDHNMKLGEEYMDKALQINNKNKFALESKGICRIHFSDDRHAIPYLKNAMLADSNAVGPINYLGIAYRNISQVDTALYYFGIAMNKDRLFSYPADNYIQMLLLKQRINAVDSVLQVLQKRFPNDMQLYNKVTYWHSQRLWK